MARPRIDARLKKQAEAVLKEIGLSPRSALELFYAQIIKLRGLPFTPSEFPVLQEYGVSLADAEAAEESALREIRLDRTAGRVVEFKGKLR